jgi:hypothetical protein
VISYLPMTLIIGSRMLRVGGVPAVISSWQLDACAATGIVSLWLGVFVFGEAIRTGPVLVLLVLPATAVIAGAVALIRSPRLQALQADGTGLAGVPAGPVQAAGRR